MATRQQQANAQWVLDQIARLNPYNKQQANRLNEFYIYQSGFLAAYLASLMAEDPYIRKRFSKHLADLDKRND